MTQESKFKKYDIVVGDGYYWVVIDTVDGQRITEIDNLPDYRDGVLASTSTYSMHPEMFEKSSMQEYFDHISGRDTTEVADNETIYKLDFRCGRAGKVTGIFIATREEVELLVAERIEVDFGSVLGQYSDVHGAINKGEIQYVARCPETVRLFKEHQLESGYNPFEQKVRNFDFEKNRILEEDDMTVEDVIEMIEKRNIADAFAKKLDGRAYREELTKAEEKEAEQLGLLVVFSASDDLCDFRGLKHDENPAYHNEPIYFDGHGDFVDHECEDKSVKEVLNVIYPQFHYVDGESMWSYQTDIPHSTFNIMEDGEVYCTGMVIHSYNLQD